EFEFFLIVFAIILGFGISEILAGWGEQLRLRHRIDPHPLQIASTGIILWFHLQYIWGMWLVRGVEWTFALYFLFVVAALSIALAAHAARVDLAAEAPAIREQYFRSSRPVYALVVVFLVSVITMSVVPAVRGVIQDPSTQVGIGITIARLTVLGVIVSLAWSSSDRVHGAGLALLWLLATAVVARLLVS
nr:hypothetical protein [Myxococcota bacterium]